MDHVAEWIGSRCFLRQDAIKDITDTTVLLRMLWWSFPRPGSFLKQAERGPIQTLFSFPTLGDRGDKIFVSVL
jgi:hypothetical protein